MKKLLVAIFLVIYLLSPIDAMPCIPLDDIIVFILGCGYIVAGHTDLIDCD